MSHALALPPEWTVRAGKPFPYWDNLGAITWLQDETLPALAVPVCSVSGRPAFLDERDIRLLAEPVAPPVRKPPEKP